MVRVCDSLVNDNVIFNGRSIAKTLLVFDGIKTENVAGERLEKKNRPGGPMVGAPDSGLSRPSVRALPGGHCVAFLSKTLYCHSASLFIQVYR